MRYQKRPEYEVQSLPMQEEPIVLTRLLTWAERTSKDPDARLKLRPEQLVAVELGIHADPVTVGIIYVGKVGLFSPRTDQDFAMVATSTNQHNIDLSRFVLLEIWYKFTRALPTPEERFVHGIIGR